MVGILCSQGATVTAAELSIQMGIPGDGGFSPGNSGFTGKQAETLGCGL
ncbi:MAG: hypothetical protein ISR64_09950 [Deltaproteobacteria bacterium]|nr:hypothetical protein [Deltaproteobacteria bacterium]